MPLPCPRSLKAKAIVVVILAASLLVFSMSVLSYFNVLVCFGPGGTDYSIHGVDVSRHQGQIDWTVVSASGIRFAFIKATEGGDYVDEKFIENWHKAAESNIHRGAYHVFTYCRSGSEQAANFIDNVPLDRYSLRPAADLSSGDKCRDQLDDDLLLREFSVFRREVEQKFGAPPILYSSGNSRLTRLLNSEGTRLEWVRGLFVDPNWFYGNEWTIWQYSTRGQVNGIVGNVDMNVFRGKENELRLIMIR